MREKYEKFLKTNKIYNLTFDNNLEIDIDEPLMNKTYYINYAKIYMENTPEYDEDLKEYYLSLSPVGISYPFITKISILNNDIKNINDLLLYFIKNIEIDNLEVFEIIQVYTEISSDLLNECIDNDRFSILKC